MKSFIGFRAGKERHIPLPDSFFTTLLPIIDDLAELKVTLACWRALARKAGPVRFVQWDDLVDDEALAGLDQAALRDGLERAVARGTLLRVLARRLQGEDGHKEESWYFPNTAKGRAAVSAIQKGELPEMAAPGEIVEAHAERPNIYTLYEQTIGMLSPLIADELRDAEVTYPPAWIEDAFREAARQNVRSWAYVRKVLETRAQRDRRTGPRPGEVSDKWERFIRGEL